MHHDHVDRSSFCLFTNLAVFDIECPDISMMIEYIFLDLLRWTAFFACKHLFWTNCWWSFSKDSSVSFSASLQLSKFSWFLEFLHFYPRLTLLLTKIYVCWLIHLSLYVTLLWSTVLLTCSKILTTSSYFSWGVLSLNMFDSAVNLVLTLIWYNS